MTRFFSEPLGKRDRQSFKSGNHRIDGYFRTTVPQDIKRRYAACYVLVERDTDILAGFYTLSSNNIPLTDIPAEAARRLPRYPTAPAVLLGWLGRDARFKGQQIGEILLRDAILRIAAYALTAHAIDDPAEAFYHRHGFATPASRQRSLFMPMATALSKK